MPETTVRRRSCRSPAVDPERPIEGTLSLREGLKVLSSRSSKYVCIWLAEVSVDHRPGGLRQMDDMSLVVLAALRRHAPCTGLPVDLTPFELGDLLPPLPGQRQKQIQGICRAPRMTAASSLVR